MKITITGGRGQLGRELVRVLGTIHQVTILDLPECDVTLPGCIDSIRDLTPDVVIHAAAMTDVEGCARDPLAAYRSNALSTQNVALACQRSGAVMLYISTNEVFDGTKPSPYLEMDETHAINPYGLSKLAGERYVQTLLSRFYIVRPSWFFSPGGNNFPNRMIALARERGALTVVTDEIANPTYAPDLAVALASLIETEHFGVYHFVNEGSVSRYDFTAQILKLAGLGHVSLTPIRLAEYQRLSNPPRNGALANFAGATALGIKLRPWQEALEEFFRVQQGCA